MATLIHTHGIGAVDYSSMEVGDLTYVNEQARLADLWVVPGAFLAEDYVRSFGEILRSYSEDRAKYPNIIGFSIEGPLLGNAAGVPDQGIWSPTADQWNYLAGLGKFGLRYIVMAPDGGDLDDDIGGMTYREVFDAFYKNGVRIALGHFSHEHPELSARRTQDVISYIHDEYGPDQSLILTDHLFNDMPRNFKHVWRTEAERVDRAEQIEEVLAADWDSADLDSLLGEVPGLLLRAARDGRVLPFLNFDGDHVDLEICRKTIQFAGARNVIGITDDTPKPVLAGERLHHRPGNGLWYREDGMVAAGSGDIATQLRNLEDIGATPWDAHQIFSTNPERGLQSFLAEPSLQPELASMFSGAERTASRS